MYAGTNRFAGTSTRTHIVSNYLPQRHCVHREYGFRTWRKSGQLVILVVRISRKPALTLCKSSQSHCTQHTENQLTRVPETSSRFSAECVPSVPTAPYQSIMYRYLSLCLLVSSQLCSLSCYKSCRVLSPSSPCDSICSCHWTSSQPSIPVTTHSAPLSTDTPSDSPENDLYLTLSIAIGLVLIMLLLLCYFFYKITADKTQDGVDISPLLASPFP